MAAPKRKPFQRKRDLVRTTELYLMGWTQEQIAVEMKVSGPQINYDIAAIRKAWEAQRNTNMDLIKDKVLAEIDLVRREAWAAWRRSIGRKEDTVQEVSGEVPGGADQPTARKGKRQVKTRDLAGDPRYLMSIQWAVDTVKSLEGLDAPKRKELSGPGGGPLEVTDPVELAKVRREQSGLLRIMEQEEATNGKPPMPVRQRPGKLMILGNPQRKIKGSGFGGNGQEKAQ